MDITLEKIFDKSKIKIYLLDIIALTAIYFVPAFSHMLSLPLYLIEPMRVALIFSIIYTNRTNAYFIALTLPAFSYFVSSHPALSKFILISTELSLNVYLFYFLKEKYKNTTLIFAVSIIASKLYYYAVKYIFLYVAFLKGGLVTTPVTIQLIMLFVFTLGFYFLSKRVNKNIE